MPPGTRRPQVVGSDWSDWTQSPRVVIVGLIDPIYWTATSSNTKPDPGSEFTTSRDPSVAERPTGPPDNIHALFIGTAPGGGGGPTGGPLVKILQLIERNPSPPLRTKRLCHPHRPDLQRSGLPGDGQGRLPHCEGWTAPALEITAAFDTIGEEQVRALRQLRPERRILLDIESSPELGIKFAEFLAETSTGIGSSRPARCSAGASPDPRCGRSCGLPSCR